MSVSIVGHKDLLGNGRLDAECFHPEKLDSMRRLERFETTVGENFNQIDSRRRPEKDERVSAIGLQNITGNRISRVSQVSGQDIRSSKKVIGRGDLVISRLRSYLKQVAINYDHEDLLGSTELIVLRMKEDSRIRTEVLLAFLLTDDVQSILRWSQEGSNHPRFPKTILNDLRLPIPPKGIQDVITEQIENSNSLYGEAVREHRKAQDAIETELQFGRPIREPDRVAVVSHSDLLSQARFDAQHLLTQRLRSSLARHHDTATLGELCESIKNGRTPSKDSYWQSGYPVLKMKCLTNFGIDWSKIGHADAKYHRNSMKCSLREGDILLTSSAHAPEHIGRKVDIVVGLPERLGKWVGYVGELMRLRVRVNTVNPYYLLLFLRTDIGFSLLQGCIRGQTAHIYPRDVLEIPIPLISRDSQERVGMMLEKASRLVRTSSRLIEESVHDFETLIATC